ncbi:hypothetical protein ACQ4LE_000922 [Meloidogyne hapla]
MPKGSINFVFTFFALLAVIYKFHYYFAAMEDIKQTLYAVLGKKKLGQPKYTFTQGGKGRERFLCQLMVEGLSYVGFGNSTSKKDAQSNAARDFGQFLVREGLVTAKELPQLQVQPSDLEGNNPQYQIDVKEGTSALPQNFDFTSDLSTGRPDFQRPKTHHDQYIEQKAEEISQSESVDMTSEIHGGWTMDNCKQALNEFCQKNRFLPREYKTSRDGTNNSSTFVAENELFLPRLNRTIYGRGQGSTKKIAETTCALSIVRQLFHIGAIPSSSDKLPSNKKLRADNLSDIKVHVDPGLVTRIEDFLESVGLHPVIDGLEETTPDTPKSLLVDKKLEEFPPSEDKYCSTSIMWAPPCQNWNPWKASNIDNQPIAFWSMERISDDLLMKGKSKQVPLQLVQARQRLPVFNHREQIIKAVTEHPVVLIKGSTGCGKSTQICQYLLESHILDKRGANFNCYVTQPRRISAITLAERVANERYEQLGESVGYSVRFEGIIPRQYGAIMFVTVGVLMRKMEMGLRGISHVIVDEIHERDINTDFLLIVVRDMLRANPKLRVLLMSATIDTSLFTNYFGLCPIIEIEQRVHPVRGFFLEDVISMLKYMPQAPEPDKKKRKKRSGKPEASTSTADIDDECDEMSMNVIDELLICSDEYPIETKQALSRLTEREIPIELIEQLLSDIDQNGKPGSVLIFLPGWQMISLLWNRLMLHRVFSNSRRFVILPLHSQLSAREQHRVFEPVSIEQRKIILSTNIAETSVTIDDVVYVIDSCRVREKMYSSRNNMLHFANVWASRTNLIQRRGRAGRVQEGFCFHLVTRARFDALEEHRTAEMLRTPLHEITLTIKLLHLGSVGEFLEKAVQPPPIDAVVEAEVLLREMNALDKDLELTGLGRILARLPIEPKLGKMVLLGAALGVGDLMLTSAAATSFNTPFIPKERMHTKLSNLHRSFSGNRPSDHIGLVNVNQQFAEQIDIDVPSAENLCRRYSLSYPLLCMTREAKHQLYDVLVNHSGFPESAFNSYSIDVHGPDPNLDVFLSMLVAAYYPNVCYIRDRRRVYTLEQAVALLSNMSVCVPFNRGEQADFASPLFMFSEKVKQTNENCEISRQSFVNEFAALSLQFQLRTNCISCKQVSMISPLQLLLFGSRKVEAIGADKVRLDNMIPLTLSAKMAAKIVALRPCIEALVVRSCMHPEQLSDQPKQDKILTALIRELSSDRAWIPSGEEGLEPFEQQSSSKGNAHQYNINEQRSYATPLNQISNLSSSNPIPLRSLKRPYGSPASVVDAYGNQPSPLVPNSIGQEAVAGGMASSSNFGGRRTPYTSHAPSGGDFSSMAGYGCDYGSMFLFSKNLNSRPSSYYGNPQQNHLPQGLQQLNGMNGRGMRGFGRGGRYNGRRPGGFRRRRGN